MGNTFSEGKATGTARLVEFFLPGIVSKVDPMATLSMSHSPPLYEAIVRARLVLEALQSSKTKEHAYIILILLHFVRFTPLT